jgi:probable HAF family extracellular repeat protein
MRNWLLCLAVCALFTARLDAALTTYSFIDLGGLESGATGVNSSGQVCGVSDAPGGSPQYGFKYAEGSSAETEIGSTNELIALRETEIVPVIEAGRKMALSGSL